MNNLAGSNGWIMKWSFVLIIYTFILLSIFALAYCGYIPTQLNAIPYYDSIGHFVLYGLWGFLFAKTFEKPILTKNGFTVPLGILIIIMIAVIEEALQSLSPLRSFSLFDFLWGFTGILIACLIINMRTNKRKLMVKSD